MITAVVLLALGVTVIVQWVLIYRQAAQIVRLREAHRHIVRILNERTLQMFRGHCSESERDFWTRTSGAELN